MDKSQIKFYKYWIACFRPLIFLGCIKIVFYYNMLLLTIFYFLLVALKLYFIILLLITHSLVAFFFFWLGRGISELEGFLVPFYIPIVYYSLGALCSFFYQYIALNIYIYIYIYIYITLVKIKKKFYHHIL